MPIGPEPIEGCHVVKHIRKMERDTNSPTLPLIVRSSDNENELKQKCDISIYNKEIEKTHSLHTLSKGVGNFETAFEKLGLKDILENIVLTAVAEQKQETVEKDGANKEEAVENDGARREPSITTESIFKKPTIDPANGANSNQDREDIATPPEPSIFSKFWCNLT